MKKKALILLSGGLDSTTVLAYAKACGFDCYTLSFDYGQRHRSELEAAHLVANALGAADHRVFKMDLTQFSTSSLTNHQLVVEHSEPSTTSIPSTYVPGRNTIFLTIALGFAEVLAISDLFIGVSAVDYSGYPDCRPEYFAAFQQLANLSSKVAVEGNPIRIHTPLIYLNKAQTISLGASLGVDYSLTLSCYQADEQRRSCGLCQSCQLRQKGFRDAGVLDPTVYFS